MKLKFSRQTFEEYSNIKSHENPSSGSRVVPCNKTDSRNESNSRVSQLLRNAPAIRNYFHFNIRKILALLACFWGCFLSGWEFWSPRCCCCCCLKWRLNFHSSQWPSGCIFRHLGVDSSLFRTFVACLESEATGKQDTINRFGYLMVDD